jgi:endonuclease-8
LAEGDTILRAARRIEDALAGEPLTVSAPNPRGRAAGVERLEGRTLERAEARGKHLLLHCGELVLHSHLGMSGAWHVHPHGARWRRARGAAWAVLRGERAEAVEFGGPTMRVLSAGAVARDPVLSRLGPDVLAAAFDPGRIVASLSSAPEWAIGDALLDQRLLAGIGNIFKSEACFVARVDPWQAVGGLGPERLAALVQAAHDLMSASAERGRPEMAVYKRAGRPCPRCGAPIRSRGQGDANRTTYWCPVCQPAAAG